LVDYYGLVPVGSDFTPVDAGADDPEDDDDDDDVDAGAEYEGDELEPAS
jgi:hypothetical protein